MKIRIEFTHGRIFAPEYETQSREIGAVLEFWGIVREREGEKLLEGLHYEAYEPMAGKVMERHFKDLARIHGCESVVMVHRLGWVPVGEASLYLRVAGSHRAEALRMMGEGIDLLKLDVPIWKVVR